MFKVKAKRKITLSGGQAKGSLVARNIAAAVECGGKNVVDFGLDVPYGSKVRYKELLGEIGPYVVIDALSEGGNGFSQEESRALERRIKERGFTPVRISDIPEADNNKERQMAVGLLTAESSTRELEVVDLLDVVGLAKAFIGGDSGPSQVAQALGVPTVTLKSIGTTTADEAWGELEKLLVDSKKE